jgi:murein DD-endopeptidase MepM/ murein hydrolase activator NlpD
MHHPLLRAVTARAVRQGRGMRIGMVSLMIAAIASIAGVGSGIPTAAPASGGGAQLLPPLPPPLTVVGAFTPPLHAWDAGNRGVDLAAYTGEPVSAATSGRVLYAGLLAGRGVISIRDGSLRTTYEPVVPVVRAGDSVAAGQLIGYVSAAADACGPPGSCLHWGALQSDAYVDPMGLLRVPRVRLLPIWSDSDEHPEQLRAALGDQIGEPSR